MMQGAPRLIPVAVDPRLREPITAQLADQIRWLIALGDLRPGDRLPTVQALADHLRVNRNTVAAVYAALQDEGYLVSRRGSGTYVADNDVVRQAVQRAALGEVVDRALDQALAMGYSPEEFAAAAAARARARALVRRRQRAIFVECNLPEVEHFTETLTRELGIVLEGVLLDEVRSDPLGFRRRATAAGLVITTFFHFEEVRRVVGRTVEVFGIGAGLEIHFLRGLAELPRGTRVALCCLDRNRAARVRTLVVNAGIQHLNMLAVGVDEADRFQRVLEETDLVYVSDAAYPEAARLARDPARLRVYRLALDRAGVEMLKVRLAERASAASEGPAGRRSRKGH
jgi:GntR family transcriptional regulator